MLEIAGAVLIGAGWMLGDRAHRYAPAIWLCLAGTMVAAIGMGFFIGRTVP